MKILLFHAHAGDPLSWLIKAESRSPYCHAAVLVDRQNQAFVEKNLPQIEGEASGPLILEAYYPHVRARRLAVSELAEIDVVSVEGLTPEILGKGLYWAMDCIKARVNYGISDLFRFTAPGRVLLGEDNDQSHLKHTICSQFVFNVYRMGGLRLLNCHDFEVRPDQLLWSPYCTLLGKLSDYLNNTTKTKEQGGTRAMNGDQPGALAAGLGGKQP